MFKKSINKKETDSEISDEEFLEITEDYISICSNYAEITSQLAYSFEEFNLGHGTNRTYDLLMNSLEINRISTLHLIECIYMLDENYTWIEQSNQ